MTTAVRAKRSGRIAHNTNSRRSEKQIIMNGDLDLLIVGGGPVGMTAALEAKRLGLSVRIIERKEERSKHDSRAVVVHPRVMELLEAIQQGAVAKEIEKNAFQIEGMNAYIENVFDVWYRMATGGSTGSFNTAFLNMRTVEWGDTNYPNLYFLPQYDTEHILEEALSKEGLKIEYGVALEDLTQNEVSVTAKVFHQNNDSIEKVTSKWLLGCDGGRSKTRDLVGIHLTRHKSGLYFVIADIIFKGMPPLASKGLRKEGHVFASKNGVLALLPLPKPNAYRLAGRAPHGITQKDQVDMNEEFFEKFLFDSTGLDFKVELGPWQTIFEITHGSADAYRKGNVFLAGDASHVHSPIGGQGMNIGMQDAFSIVWKLSWAKRLMKNSPTEASKESVDMILHSYHSERHSLVKDLVSSVEIATMFIASKNVLVQFLRDIAIRVAASLNFAKDGFRKTGQLELGYPRESNKFILERNADGIVSPGQRLPNIRLNDGSNLHSHTDRNRHTWVFLNTRPGKIQLSGKVCSVVSAAFEDQVSVPRIPEKALMNPQVILVRPDHYVAGIANTPQELIGQLRNLGLSESALTTM